MQRRRVKRGHQRQRAFQGHAPGCLLPPCTLAWYQAHGTGQQFRHILIHFLQDAIKLTCLSEDALQLTCLSEVLPMLDRA